MIFKSAYVVLWSLASDSFFEKDTLRFFLYSSVSPVKISKTRP
jgi:hypothetical protein